MNRIIDKVNRIVRSQRTTYLYFPHIKVDDLFRQLKFRELKPSSSVSWYLDHSAKSNLVLKANLGSRL